MSHNPAETQAPILTLQERVAMKMAHRRDDKIIEKLRSAGPREELTRLTKDGVVIQKRPEKSTEMAPPRSSQPGSSSYTISESSVSLAEYMIRRRNNCSTNQSGSGVSMTNRSIVTSTEIGQLLEELTLARSEIAALREESKRSREDNAEIRALLRDLVEKNKRK